MYYADIFLSFNMVSCWVCWTTFEQSNLCQFLISYKFLHWLENAYKPEVHDPFLDGPSCTCVLDDDNSSMLFLLSVFRTTIGSCLGVL